MRVETIRIKNFKALRNVTMSQIPNFCVIVGANGTGKTTLFDVFSFLQDCLTHNVTKALQSRGGFEEVISRNSTTKQIEFELLLRADIDGTEHYTTYKLHIGSKKSKAIILHEALYYTCGSAKKIHHVLDFQQGEGFTIHGEKKLTKEFQKLDAPDTMALKGVGQFQRFQVASACRQFIEQWHISDFRIDQARGSKQAGYDEHLSAQGENLQLVAYSIYKNHPTIFDTIISQMKQRVPGIGDITPELTADGRLVLKFQDGSFKDPFIDTYISDGTLKIFAYLLLLYAPEAYPLLCIEEPENQLYPKLLWELAEEFESYTQHGGQVFVSTHSPDFLNGVGVNNVFWLEKHNGYTIIKRANQHAQIVAYMQEGDQMGYLWKQGFFEKVDLC